MIPWVASVDDTKDFTQRMQPGVFPFKVAKALKLFLVLEVGFSLFSLYTTRRFTVQNRVMQARSTFQSCFKEGIDLGHWIRPLSKLLHLTRYEDLLWRASFVPEVKKYPYKSNLKIAFMFLTRGTLPLAPLWEKFYKEIEGFYSIYILALPSYVANFSSSSPFYQRQIPNQVAFSLRFIFIGETVRVVRRLSLPDVDEHELLKNAGVFRFPRVSCAAGSSEDADLDPGVAGLPPGPLLEKLARELRRRLDMVKCQARKQIFRYFLLGLVKSKYKRRVSNS